jgi:hypothetical protein
VDGPVDFFFEGLAVGVFDFEFEVELVDGDDVVDDEFDRSQVA